MLVVGVAGLVLMGLTLLVAILGKLLSAMLGDYSIVQATRAVGENGGTIAPICHIPDRH